MNTSFAVCKEAPAASFIQSFWQTEGSPSYTTETILPKGNIELIFSFGETLPFKREGDMQSFSTPRCFINGISNRPLCLHMPGQQFFFGVVLHPAAVKKMISAPSGEFMNAVEDLEAINKEFTSLWHQLAETVSFKERISITQKWAIKRMASLDSREIALSSFLKNGDTAEYTVAHLAATLCYSPRQLQRKANQIFGMATEALISYKKYLQAIELMHREEETLTGICYLSGYYDQSHFIREFKNYTGLTPGEYKKKKSHLPGHIYQ